MALSTNAFANVFSYIARFTQSKASTFHFQILNVLQQVFASGKEPPRRANSWRSIHNQ